ncbi:MAG TPA: nitrogen regulation protein NR(I) [Pseudomonadales bacterium]|nr:nitrogen regulation protein NR(I) [Pseudomonadales bacterium]
MANLIVWVVDDDDSIRWVLNRAFEKAGFTTRDFANGELLLDALKSAQQPHVIVSDIRMPGTDGFDVLSEVNARFENLPIVIMTAHSDLETTVTSFERGAFEYVAKPFDIDDIVATVRRAANQTHLRQDPIELDAEPSANGIVGRAPAMQEVFRAIGRLTQSTATVMITGESGSGKELVAQALHDHSPRATGPLVALNMAAIPSELIESELFGHERGAFTGATEQRAGRFEQANGGSLFLDEIGDMPLPAQTRLLRVLAEGSFYRVGGRHNISVDVRIITATHRNLESLVLDSRFRDDLYHRINVIRIHVPALRDRKPDIAILASHFLAGTAQELGVEPKTLSTEVIALFETLDWPGNVRQLENTCRWLTVMAPAQEVLVTDLPPELTDLDKQVPKMDWELALGAWVKQKLDAGAEDVLSTAIPSFERVLIKTALAHTNGRKREAAKLLGWGRNTLTRKLSELGAGI